jgi:hypothetical protein
MHGLQHLALAAAAGPLVQDGHHVIVRRDDLNRRRMGRQPAFLLALVYQHAVRALLGTRPRIQVVGENLVHVGLPVVDHDLLALTMGMAERRREVQDRLGCEIQEDLLGGKHLLQIGQGAAEKRRVLRAHQQGGIPQFLAAGVQGQHDQILSSQPLQGLVAKLLEGESEPIRKLRLVGRLVVGDHHAIRVPSPHVRLGVIDRQAISTPRHDRLDISPQLRNLISDLENILIRVATHS